MNRRHAASKVAAPVKPIANARVSKLRDLAKQYVQPGKLIMIDAGSNPAAAPAPKP